jgi:cytochrome c
MALAATVASKDEAVAMVKKAVGAIKAEGPGKAYPEISNPTGKFVDGDLYIVVYGLDGLVLAHGADAKRIGTNQLADTDPDAKPSCASASNSPRRIRASGRPTNS